MPAFAQRRVHSGKETTFGTAVPATAILMGVESITPKFDSSLRSQRKYLDGTLNPANTLVQTGEGGGFSMTQAFSFEDCMCVLCSALVSTTPAAGPPKVWTFPFPYASAPTLQSRTFEFYDGTGTSYRADSSIVKSFTLGSQVGGANLVTLASEWESIKLSKQTVTSLSTLRTPTLLPTGYGALYIDALGGTMGSTVKADTLIDWSLSFSGLAHMKRFQSGGLGPTTYAADGVPTIELDTRLEFNSTGVGAIDNYLATTGKLIQIKSTVSSNYILTVEGAFHPVEATVLDDRDGNTVCSVKWRAFYDATYAKVGQVVVTNLSATVTDA